MHVLLCHQYFTNDPHTYTIHYNIVPCCHNYVFHFRYTNHGTIQEDLRLERYRTIDHWGITCGCDRGLVIPVPYTYFYSLYAWLVVSKRKACWVQGWIHKMYVLGTRVRSQRSAVVCADYTNKAVSSRFDYYGAASLSGLILVRTYGAFV